MEIICKNTSHQQFPYEMRERVIFNKEPVFHNVSKFSWCQRVHSVTMAANSASSVYHSTKQADLVASKVLFSTRQLAPNATPKAVFISTKATCFFLDLFHNNKTKVLVKAQEFWWNARCIKGSVQCSPLTHSPQMLHQRLCSYQQKPHRLLWMRQWIK